MTLRDIDAAKVAALNDGQVPIYEPGLAELMARARRPPDASRISLERDARALDIVFIAVGHAADLLGDADLSRVMGVVDELERSAPTAATSWS